MPPYFSFSVLVHEDLTHSGHSQFTTYAAPKAAGCFRYTASFCVHVYHGTCQSMVGLFIFVTDFPTEKWRVSKTLASFFLGIERGPWGLQQRVTPTGEARSHSSAREPPNEHWNTVSGVEVRSSVNILFCTGLSH